MVRPSSLTPDLAAQIAALSASGATKAGIAAVVGRDPQTLMNWVQRGAREPDSPYHVVYEALSPRQRGEGAVSKTCTDCGLPFAVAAYEASRFSRCRTCRARHRATSRQCATCGEEFLAAPSSNRSRCETCVSSGRGRCVACDETVVVQVGVQGVALCARCRRSETDPDHLQRGYVRLVCRGVTAFGSTRRALRCENARITTMTRARGRLRTLDEGTMSYVCDHCHGLVIRNAGAKRRQRDLRCNGLLDPGESLAQGSVRSHQDVTALVMRQAEASGRWSVPDASRLRHDRPSAITPEAAWKRAAGFWRKRHEPFVALDLCRGCGLLTMNALADVERGVGPLAFHRPCYDLACGTTEGRDWWKSRMTLRRGGVSKTEVDERLLALPPTATLIGRPPNPDILKRHFGWAVRRLLGGEKEAAIAASAGVTSPAVRKGIDHILALLPPPEDANVRLQKYVIALRAAAVGAARSHPYGSAVEGPTGR